MIFLVSSFIFLMSLHGLAQGNFSLPSLESYQYNSKYKDISLHTNQPVGVAIIAFNRPHYLKQLIASLEKNPESQTLPFYFFLDGGPRAKQKEIIEVIEQSLIKHKEIICRPRNVGCSKNGIDSMRFMLDWCGFNKIIYFEDDLLVSPFYITVTLNLHKWALENYRNVGAVSCWSYCFLDRDTKEAQREWVQEPPSKYFFSFVTYCLDKSVWDKIKPILYEYETQFVDRIPHSEKFAGPRSLPTKWADAQKIRAWMIQLRTIKDQQEANAIVSLQMQDGKKDFPASRVNKDISNHFSPTNKFNVNFDDLLTFSMWMNGYLKIETVVNRVIHIGDEGISMNPYLINYLEINKVKLDIFNEDINLTVFKEVPK